MNIGRKRGMGAFEQTQDWGWMFNPPPYDFLDRPSQKVPNVNFYASARSMGFSGLGCGPESSCGCKKAAAAPGLGLFDSTDFSEWGWAEGLAIAAGLYAAFSLVGDVKTGAAKVRRISSKRKGLAARKYRAKQVLREL